LVVFSVEVLIRSFFGAAFAGAELQSRPAAIRIDMVLVRNFMSLISSLFGDAPIDEASSINPFICQSFPRMTFIAHKQVLNRLGATLITISYGVYGIETAMGAGGTGRFVRPVRFRSCYLGHLRCAPRKPP
jgi:hypothetical protein